MDIALRLLLGLLVLIGLIAAARLRGGGDLSDPRRQLAAVKRARFEPRPVMNKAEFRLFVILEECCAGSGFRVFPQIPYGEILASPDEAAFRSINSKRADFLLVDRRGMPALAVEYQGEGHWAGNAKGRDAVKRAALAAAGIDLFEVFPGMDRDEIALRVEGGLRGGKTSPQRSSRARRRAS